MYTLYWHPTSSSYAPMAVLEELGVSFDLREVDYARGDNRSPDYLRLQPLGLVPAMKIGDDRSMFESAAIILYLCDRHREAGLAPETSDPDRAAYLQWMLYLADTLYPSYNRYYHPARYTDDAQGAEAIRICASSAALRQWQVIEDALSAGGPWLLGPRFSACDIYLQMMTTWHESPAGLLDRFPAVREVAAGVVARPACRRAIARHDFATGLD
jgi:glutathione S-transferase